MDKKLLENLLPATKEVFTKLSEVNLDFLENFVLVGGSALALRLEHRQSEDLDFFTHKDWFDKSRILSISKRSLFRDYYDNYVLSKYHIGLERIYNNASKFIPGMSFRLFSTALTYTAGIKDENINYLKPKYKVTKSEIQAYFEKEIKEYIEKELIKSKNQSITSKPDAFSQDLQNRLNKNRGIKR